MRSGYIISLLVLIIAAIGTYGDYILIDRSDFPNDYKWLIWINAIMIIPVIGLLMHKNWGRVILKLLLWLSVGSTFFMGLAFANAGPGKGVASAAIESLRSHWMQFLVYGGLLFYLNTAKVKKDFNLKVNE